MRKGIYKYPVLLAVFAIVFTSCTQRNFSGRRYTKSSRQYKEGAEFMHAVGGQVSFGLDKGFGYRYPVGGLFYHPRVNVAKFSSEGSFSFDFPITLMLGKGSDIRFYSNPLEVPKSRVGLTMEIPIALGFNFGNSSTKSSVSKFGFFFNAGYSFSYISQGVAVKDALPIGHGPRGMMGFRFQTGPIGWQLHGNVMYNIYQPSHLAGFGIGIILGSWNR